MNKRLSILFYVLMFSGTIGLSCQKVIDLSLNDMPPKLVIESYLSNISGQQIVSLSRTLNFDSPTAKEPVSGAVIILTDENNAQVRYTEDAQSPGIYRSVRYRGTPGRTYTLSVMVNGQSYQATSTMPLPVDLQTVNQAEMSFLGERRKVLEISYKDPIGVSNYYNCRVFINGKKRDQLFVDSDRFTDGRDVKNTLYLGEPYLKTGDVVRIQLLTIDERVYRYLFSFTQISGNGGPPTAPANPVSNFSNGALGYFSASTLSEQTVNIQ
ncbi:hypothetical protein D9M68_698490 [compost metagenome]